MNPDSTEGTIERPPIFTTPEDIAERPSEQPRPASLVGVERWVLASILGLAALLRFADLNGASLWFDELVSYRVASADDPLELLDLLKATDATRAPFHPLLVHGWMKLAGNSVLAGRAFSAVCGIGVVACVYWLGRRLFDRVAASFAGILAAVSPPLVYYSRELRMYSLLTLLACVAWLMIAVPPARWSASRSAAYGAVIVALGYTHPLAAFLIVALAVQMWLDRQRSGLTPIRWLGLHAFAALLLIPAVLAYTDHAPDYSEPAGRSLRLLLGFPIGFIGGNFLSLAACLAVIAWGLWADENARRTSRPLWLWLVVPVGLLYAASWIGTPLFGPSRYTLFVAPAYLLLMGHGLSRLPRWWRVAGGLMLVVLAVPSLAKTVYAPGLKADWRGASALIRSLAKADGSPVDLAIVVIDPRYVGELEVARHYLGPDARVRVSADAWPTAPDTWLAVGLRDGQPAAPLPLTVGVPTPVIEIHRFPGLLLLRAVR